MCAGHSARNLSCSQAVPDRGWKAAWDSGIGSQYPSSFLAFGLCEQRLRSVPAEPLAVWGVRGGGHGRGAVSPLLLAPWPLWLTHPLLQAGGQIFQVGVNFTSASPNHSQATLREADLIKCSRAPMGCHQHESLDLHLLLWHDFVQVIFLLCCVLCFHHPLRKLSSEQLIHLWLIQIVLKPRGCRGREPKINLYLRHWLQRWNHLNLSLWGCVVWEKESSDHRDWASSPRSALYNMIITAYIQLVCHVPGKVFT